MSVLLAAIGVLAFGGAPTSQVPRFGGLYLFEAGKYTYPNGETWGPLKGNVFISQTDQSETLIYLPGSRNPFIGLVSANFISAKSEVLGTDFARAPSSIQRQINERQVQRDLSLAISADARRLTGKLELFDVKWTGDTLDRITPHEHDVTFTRVECQVKDFQFVVQDFDKVSQQHHPERAKQVADAETLWKNSIANFQDSLLQMQKTLPPIADAIKAATTLRVSIPRALADIDTAGAGLSNAAHKKLVQDINRLVARRQQIADRLAAIRRDMPSTPASVTKPLQDESVAIDKQLAPKRLQRERLEFQLGIEPAIARAKIEVENRELGLIRLLRDLDKAKINRDLATADVVEKLEAYYRWQENLNKVILSTRFEPSPFIPKVNKVTVEAGGVVFEAKPDQPFEAESSIGKRIETANQKIRRVDESLKIFRQDFTELKRQMLLDAEAMIRSKLSSAYAEDPVKVNQTNNEIVAACLTNTVNELSGLLADELQKTPLVTSAEWDDFFSYRLMSPGGSDIYPAELASTVFIRRRGRDFLQWDFVDRVGRFVLPEPRISQMPLKSSLAEAAYGKSDQVVKDSWKIAVQNLNASLELPWRRSLIDSLASGSSVANALDQDAGLGSQRVEKLLEIRGRYRTQLDDKTFTNIADVAMAKVNAFLPPTRSATDTQRRTIWRRILKNGARIKAVGLVIQRLQQAKWEVYSEIQHLLDVHTHLTKAMDLFSLKVVSNPKFFPIQLPTVKVTLDRQGYDPSGGRMESTLNRTAMIPIAGTSTFSYPNNPAGHRALSDSWNLELRMKAR